MADMTRYTHCKHCHVRDNEHRLQVKLTKDWVEVICENHRTPKLVVKIRSKAKGRELRG